MDIPQESITKNAQETTEIGRALGSYFLSHIQREETLERRLICLYGELGSGKTTFAQGFAKGLGINNRLLSPTFIIVRRYGFVQKSHSFYHIDFYRLEKESEVLNLGITDIVNDPDSIAIIEWAERAEKLLSKERIVVYCSILPHGQHKIVIKEI